MCVVWSLYYIRLHLNKRFKKWLVLKGTGRLYDSLSVTGTLPTDKVSKKWPVPLRMDSQGNL